MAKRDLFAGLALAGLASGVALGQNVTGQWDFEESLNGLKATIGADMAFYGGCPVSDCSQDLKAETQFVTSGDVVKATYVDSNPDSPTFGQIIESDVTVPTLNGDAVNVMYWAADVPCTAYLFPHSAAPNGGENVTKVNQFTLSMDIYIDSTNYFERLPGHSPDWIALWQSWPGNDGDAMLWIRTSDANMGDDGDYPDSMTLSCLEDTWLRIIVTYDAAANEFKKYVFWTDGTSFSGIQGGDGVDGKRSLTTKSSPGSDEDVLYLFADDDQETGRGFCSSVQFRNEVLTEEQVMELGAGGPSVRGIPLTTEHVTADSVTGQWEFEDLDNGYKAAIGRDAEIWVRVIEPDTTEIEANTKFGKASEFGLPNTPDGGDPGVISHPALTKNTGYWFLPGIEANGGGEYVNQYTLIYDQLYTSDSDSKWRSFLNTNACNDNDQDLALNPGNGIGISGNYAGSITANEWHRVVFTVDLANGPTLGRYIDGVDVGSMTLGSGVDGRWALYTLTQGVPAQFLGDNDGDSQAGYTAAFQVRDYIMTAEEVAALGGVSASGIPGVGAPSTPGDMNCDGSVDFNDIDPFVSALISEDDYNAENPGCNYKNGDVNNDGSVDFNDIDGFVECLINGSC